MLFPTINLRIERWKFNKDYGIYVSTLGNFKDRYKRRLPIKINQKGYCLVKTEVPNRGWKLAHRLVMLTWKPIPDAENLTVDHLNHNKRYNALENLEWVTREENERRAKKDRIATTPNANDIITKEEVILKKHEIALDLTNVKKYMLKNGFIGFKVNGIFYETPKEAIFACYEANSDRTLQVYYEAILNIVNGKNQNGIKTFKKTVIVLGVKDNASKNI